ncbi:MULTISPECIES: DUF4760 domain-containing protein [Pseudomonas]|uniref:DUF4760 domain-containing protein n=1 Tax=Pseudomonas TaxID=286 RepID=UPI0012D7075F|nr:DUF4760 domain-containing protein [Pseudomonas monteilii]
MAKKQNHGFRQGLFLATAAILIVVICARNTDFLVKKYHEQILDEWIGLLIFSALSALLINQLYAKIYERYVETRRGIKYIALSLFAIMVSTYVVLRFQEAVDYQTSLALFVSSALLGAGWWVQATISSAAARKAHTVNTIMNQRNSELFIQKNDFVMKMFPRKKTINPVFNEHMLDPHSKKFQHAKFSEEYQQAARDLSYVLNYYEFIAVGVLNGDFDEHLMKECFVGILVSLEKRAYLVIQASQKIQNPKIFESIVALVDRWGEQKSMTTRCKENQNVEAFDMHPPQEETDRMMAAPVAPPASGAAHGAGHGAANLAAVPPPPPHAHDAAAPAGAGGAAPNP